MTYKEQIRETIHKSFSLQDWKNGENKGAEALINKFLDGISEQQAEAILSLDNFIEKYTDGIQTQPFEIGAVLWLLISITAADNNGNPPSLEDVKETAQGYANRSANTEPGASFWSELALSLESAGASPESVAVFRAITPKKYVMPVNKLHNNLAEISDSGESTITVINANGKKPAVTTWVQLSFEDNNVSLTGETNITEYDKSIFNGVISQLEAGNRALTPAMIYRAVAGLDDAQYVSPQQKAAVTKSIEKMRRTWINIDATAEYRAYLGHNKNMKVQKANFDTHLIVADRATAIINGARHSAYIFANTSDGAIKMPALYDYAKISGQILNVPVEAMRLPINNTEKNIILRDYLLREIWAIRNPKSPRRPEISYQGIYKHLDIKQNGSTAKTEMKRTRDATEKILEYWVNTDFIKSFSTYKNGRTIAGVTVTP